MLWAHLQIKTRKIRNEISIHCHWSNPEMGGYLSKGDAVLPTSSCILHFIFLNFVFWRGTTNSFPPVAIVVVAPLSQSCDKLWWGPFLPLASQMSPQPLNFQQILNYSNRRLNADKIRDIPSSSRFEVFFLQKELCWAQFDLAAHKKISFQVPLEKFVNIRLRAN